jgi:hypothetical protein
LRDYSTLEKATGVGRYRKSDNAQGKRVHCASDAQNESGYAT